MLRVITHPQEEMLSAFCAELEGTHPDKGINDVIIDWIKDSESESFFTARYDMIHCRLDLDHETMRDYRDKFPNHERLAKASKAALRAIEDLQDELRAWNRIRRQPLSQRERDVTRRALPRRDYVKSCTKQVENFTDAWDRAIYIYRLARAQRAREGAENYGKASRR